MAYTAVDIQTPEFTYDLEKNSAVAVRVVRVTPWDSVDEAITDLGGGAVATGNILLVTQPSKFPGKDHLWLHKIKVKPFHDCLDTADSDGLPTDPAGAEFTLTYQTPNFQSQDGQRPDLPDTPADTYLTVSRNMSLEFVAEDAQGLYWPAGLGGGKPYQAPGGFSGHPLPIESQISAHVAIADIQLTWYRVKYPPWKAINALQGMVNDSTFMGYAAEQVMFVGVQDQNQLQTDGTSIYQLTYQFNCRVPKFKQKDFADNLKDYLPEYVVRGGWNHFPRKGGRGTSTDPYWQKVYRKAGDSGASDPNERQTDQDLLYIPGNFDLLFEPDQSAS